MLEEDLSALMGRTRMTPGEDVSPVSWSTLQPIVEAEIIVISMEVKNFSYDFIFELIISRFSKVK